MNLLRPRPDLSAALKISWLGALSLLLGPLSIWAMLDGKKHRRDLVSGYPKRLFVLVSLFLACEAGFFLIPLHWSAVLGLYVLAAGVSTWAISRRDHLRFFALPTDAAAHSRPAHPFPDMLVAVSLAVLPLVYILSLIRNIGDLGSFSIRLPSDVYSGGLLWMAYALPAVCLVAWIAWKSSFRPGLRTLLYFYAAVVAVLCWLAFWERLDLMIADSLALGERMPVLFGHVGEARWRVSVKAACYGLAFILGIAYLVGAARTSVFFKRAVLLGLPSLLLYGHMQFFLGDWNRYLGSVREAAYTRHQYGLYRLAAAAELARTPRAYEATFLREQLADLEYRRGNGEAARRLLRRVAEDGRRHAYHAEAGARAERSLANLERPHGPPLVLDLPAIKPASYLDREWYAVLGAVAFLRPDWTDLDLRKRLLDLSSTVHLHLPKLRNLPELAAAFRQLGIPISPCFLTRERAIAALAAGRIPFLSLDGRWVPLSGYDPGRDGFYYWSYRDPVDGGLFRNEDVDLFHHAPGESFGGKRGRAEPRYSLQQFIPAADLEKHVLDIGGVAVILGDSAFAGPGERRAAFLVEQGDVHYQDHDNYEAAAACYREAAGLFGHDQVHSRILYLKHRYRALAADPRDYRNLFRDYPPEWMRDLGPEGAEAVALRERILAGKLGSYILMNWHEPPPPGDPARTAAGLDTALRLFSTLHALDPHEPLYVDSLADLRWRRGDTAASDSLYGLLADMDPLGDEHARFRLAWVRYRRGRTGGLADLLAQCGSYADDPRHLTMRGALALERGREGQAFLALTRSLKLDKSLGETHALLAEYYRRRGDAASEAVHRLWQKRSS